MKEEIIHLVSGKLIFFFCVDGTTWRITALIG